MSLTQREQEMLDDLLSRSSEDQFLVAVTRNKPVKTTKFGSGVRVAFFLKPRGERTEQPKQRARPSRSRGVRDRLGEAGV